MWNFSEFHTQYISLNLLRSSDFDRCFLNVDLFRSSHLVYFEETSEKFDFSSIFSKSWIFRRSILSTFRWNPWEVWSFIDIFWVWNFFEVHTQYIFDETLEKFGLSSIFSRCEFFRGPHSTFSMELLRSSVFHRYFLSVEFFRGPHLVHFWWISWEVRSFLDIF